MLPHLRPYSKPLQDKKKDKKFITKRSDEISAQLETISKLDQLHKYNLNCFEQFSKKSRHKPDFIEALLDTGVLNATNPLEYIYGIIGMTEFPAKAMTVQERTMARQHEVFIPIDYSTNLISILFAVTLAALMKDGLAVPAKFKAFTTDDDNNACKYPIPSLVIDWGLAARLFRREDGKIRYNHVDEWDVKLNNAWGIRLPEGRMWPSPATQEQFCQDNRDSSVTYTKLILRGMVDPTFRAEGNCIWEKRRWLTDKAVWQLECDVYPTDLVVYMLGFIALGYQVLSSADNLDNGTAVYSYYRGGLWLLRPAGDDEVKLIACLPFLSGISPPLYFH